MLVPHETLEEEFLALAEAEGVVDIDELNKILDNAVNLKNFFKSKTRVEAVAEYVAEHYRENVEPLGYKAFLVAVDREACALYKEALDQHLPPEYSKVVYTGSNNDSALLKRFYIDTQEERSIRRGFARVGEQPHVLIVTEKLLTGFDAPILYAMYLDKPMRDHTLLQAIARVNRPYENDEEQMVKPHGFVLDFVGIFEKLERALAFDSDEVNAVVNDIVLLKSLFQQKMEGPAADYRKAYTKQVYVDKEFQRKTADLVKEHVSSGPIGVVETLVPIDAESIELIKRQKGDSGTQVINLVKSIEKAAEDQSDDPYLIAMAARAEAIRDAYENRQKDTSEALEEIIKELEENERHKREQAEKGFDGLTYFVYRTLLDNGVKQAEATSRRIRIAFVEYPSWKRSDSQYRELRKAVNFAIYAELDDPDEVTGIVDELFDLLQRAESI